MINKKDVHSNGKDYFKLTQFIIKDVNGLSNGFVTYKVVLKYEGKQLTTTYTFIPNRQFRAEEVMREVLENYIEYSYLTDFNANRRRYEGASNADLDSLFKECKRVKEGLERLYGLTGVNELLTRFNVK